MASLTVLPIYNPARKRYEYVARNPDNTTRIIAVLAPDGSDVSDLPPGTPVEAVPDDVAQAIAAAESGDTAAQSYLSRYNQSLIDDVSRQQARPGAGQPDQGAPPQGQTVGVRQTPAQMQAATNQVGSVLTAREKQDTFDQQEHAIRVEMANAGYNPQQIADFFNAVSPPVPAGGTPEQTSFMGQMPPEYNAAYLAQANTAIRGGEIARQERINQIRNNWEAHKTGAENLTNLGDIRRAKDKAQQELQTSEAFLSSRAANDKSLRPQGASGWVHGEDAGLASDIDKLSEAELGWYAAHDPNAYQAARRQAISPTSPEYVLQSWGITDEEKRRRAQGLPPMAGGGQFGTGYEGGAFTPAQDTSGNSTWGNPAATPLFGQIAQDQQRRQTREAATGLDEQRLQAEYAGLQAEVANRESALRAEHEQAMGAIQARYQTMGQAFQRRQGELAAQRAALQRELQLVTLPQQGSPTFVG